MTGDDLALTVQEVLTAVVRLRSKPDLVKSAAAFRANILENIRAADNAARQKGYSGGDVKLAMFAVVALLDETVLNSRTPVFTDWHKEPLAQTLFGRLDAGEVVFINIQKLLARDDSPQLADILEVYYTCLLLGFCGRYHFPEAPELGPIKKTLAEKIYRNRGSASSLFKTSDPTADALSPHKSDPWVRRLIWSGVAVLVLCIVCFATFKYRLTSGVDQIRAIADQAASK